MAVSFYGERFLSFWFLLLFDLLWRFLSLLPELDDLLFIFAMQWLLIRIYSDREEDPFELERLGLEDFDLDEFEREDDLETDFLLRSLDLLLLSLRLLLLLLLSLLLIKYYISKINFWFFFKIFLSNSSNS